MRVVILAAAAIATGSIATAQTTSSTTSATVAAPAQTSTASAQPAVQAAKPRKLVGEIFSQSGLSASSWKDSSKQASAADNFIGLKYKMENGRSITVRQPFTFNQNFPIAAEPSFKYADLSVGYTEGKLASFGKDGNVAVKVGLGLPTGESSRFITKRNGYVTLTPVISHSIGKVSATQTFLGAWFNQTQDSYLDDKGKRAPVAQYRFISDTSLGYDVVKDFNIGLGATLDMNWKRPDDANGVSPASVGTFGPSLSATYTIQEGLSAGLSVANEMNINELQAGRDSEINYYLTVSATL